MSTTPINQREGRGGISDIRDRLGSVETENLLDAQGIANMAERISDVESQGIGDPGDLRAIFRNALI